MNKRNQGFTLIELLVALSIVSLLASIVMVSLSSTKNKAKNSIHVQNLTQLKLALELYAQDHGGLYPLTGPPDGVYLTNDINRTSYSPEWIPGLVTQGYIPKLPDFVPNYGATPGACANDHIPTSYFYRSDNGSGYKIMVKCPEAGVVNQAFDDPNTQPNRALYNFYSVCAYNTNYTLHCVWY